MLKSIIIFNVKLNKEYIVIAIRLIIIHILWHFILLLEKLKLLRYYMH